MTGEHLVTGKMGLVNNWAQGLDGQGRPKRNPNKDATIRGSSSSNGDVTNYPPASYSPDTGFFYVHETNSLRLSYLIDPDPRGSMGLGGTMNGGGLNYGSFLDAIDYKNGKVVWRHELGGTAAFSRPPESCSSAADGDNLVAWDPANRQAALACAHRRDGNAPETYMIDGHQYLLATGGDQLFAFVLNSIRADF